jgi:DNA-binding MarR family transcriptional regulator
MSDLRSFGFFIKDISRLYTRRFEERASSLGLTISECKVLVYLARNEGVSQARLCELTEIEPMSLVRILDHMQSEGWLERRPDPADRRARQLYLKPKSMSMIEDIWSISDAVRGTAFAGIPQQQAKLLISLLEKIHANVLAAHAAAEALPGAASLAAKGPKSKNPRYRVVEKS